MSPYTFHVQVTSLSYEESLDTLIANVSVHNAEAIEDAPDVFEITIDYRQPKSAISDLSDAFEADHVYRAFVLAHFTQEFNARYTALDFTSSPAEVQPFEFSFAY